MKILIVTDSGCTLSELECKNLGIVKLPLSITDGSKTFDDNEGFEIEKAITEILSNSKSYKTSATQLGKIIECIENNQEKYDQIWFFPISKLLSSQYNQSKPLENMYPKFKCFDTEEAAYGQQGIVIAAHKIANSSESVEKRHEQINEIISNNKKKSMSLFVLNKVEGAIKSGRLGKMIVKIVNTIKIKFIISFDGKLEKYAISTKIESAIEKIMNSIKKSMTIDNVNDEIIFYEMMLEEKFKEVAKEKAKKILNIENLKFIKLPNIFAIHTLSNVFGMYIKKGNHPL